MKICIVGCGNQGAGLAGLLAQEEDVKELVLVHRDINKAKRAMTLINSLGSRVRIKKIRIEQADALKTEEVARAAKGSDIVFNGILPNCNIPIMNACLKIKAHYLDLLSGSRELPGVPDSETVEAQLEMDETFKAAGLTALPCLGISPGWTNLAAKYIIDKLDTVDQLIIRNVDWIDSCELLAPAPPVVMLSMWLGPPNPVCLENGHIKEIDLLSSEEIYEFPAPVGKRSIFTQTSVADGVMTQKFAGKPIKYIEEKGAVLTGGLGAKDIWIKAIQQQTSKHKGTDDMIGLFGKSFKPTMNLNFKEAHQAGLIKDGAFASSVEVIGKKNGLPVKHTIYDICTMSEAIKRIPWAGPGVLATVGGVPMELIFMLGRGELNKRGVLTIADIEKPEVIFNRMRGRGHRLSEKIERALEL